MTTSSSPVGLKRMSGCGTSPLVNASVFMRKPVMDLSPVGGSLMENGCALGRLIRAFACGI